jgi:hypothetical protein
MTEQPGANALVVARLLAFSGFVLAVIAVAAWAGWLPFSAPAARALTLIFFVTAAVDLLIAFFFMARYRR